MTAAMLKWAKTKSAFKNQKNVKEAKKFSDLTPAKQKIIKSQYEKSLTKQASGKLTPAQERAKDNRESFERDFKVGDKVYFQTGKNEKAKITAGSIEGFTDKGVVMKAEKGEVTRTSGTKPNFKVSYRWKPTGGTMKKVVSWSRTRGAESYNGRNVSVGTVGG